MLYIMIYSVFYMKTITISDEVYEKLERIKGRRSFSELINHLISSNTLIRIERLKSLSDYATGREDELLKAVKKIKTEFKTRSYEAS